MRGGSNGHGNFTFMQEVPSGLDHVPDWLFNSPLEEGWRTPNELGPREVARPGSPQREGGPLDVGVWGVIGTRNTNVPSRLPVPARMGVSFMHFECAPMPPSFPISSSPSSRT